VRKFETVKCTKFLADVPECVVEALKAHPNETLTLRCGSCEKEYRFINVYYDKSKGLTFKATSDQPDWDGEVLKFDDLRNVEQIG